MGEEGWQPGESQASGPAPEARSAADGTRGAADDACGGRVALLLRHEQGASTPRLLEALLELRSGDAPAGVRDAAGAIVCQYAPWALALAEMAKGLAAAAGSERDQRLLLAWVSRSEGQTFEELAEREGICRRNANRHVHRAAPRVREALAVAPAPLRWAVSALRERLGAVAPVSQLDDELARLGAAEPPAPGMLAWLAGPYLSVPGRPGWLAKEPKEALDRTAACLAEDGGVRHWADVQAELADLDLKAANLRPWLACNGAAVVHDVVVSVEGPLGDVVERVLDAYGTALTPHEIVAELSGAGRSVSLEALAKVLGSRRFARSGSGAVRLTAWGLDEPQTAKVKTRQAGPKQVKAVGARQARPKPQQGTLKPQQGKTAGAQQAKAAGSSGAEGAGLDGQLGQGRLWLWARVDADVLRGSEAPVPLALVEGLGVAPLARRTFSSRWGPLTLANEAPQPVRGPLRAVALATGARPGDTLLLGFSPRGDLEVDLRRGAGQAGLPEVAPTEAVISHETFHGTVNGGSS
ncbi:MAG: hypothetical protein ACP5VR_00430 [Acidimicrobiales bacterium]